MVEAMRDAATIADLRIRRDVSQVELAARLGKAQATVSATERREDVYLSTLREYIEALGGELEVTAVFPEERIPVRMAPATA